MWKIFTGWIKDTTVSYVMTPSSFSNVIDPILTRKVNEADSLSFTLTKSHALYGVLKVTSSVWAVNSDESYHMMFVIQEIHTDLRGNKTYYAKSVMEMLKNALATPITSTTIAGDSGKHTWRARAIMIGHNSANTYVTGINKCLEGYRSTSYHYPLSKPAERTYPYTRFTLETDIASLDRSWMTFEGKSAFDCIDDIRKECGKHMMVKHAIPTYSTATDGVRVYTYTLVIKSPKTLIKAGTRRKLTLGGNIADIVIKEDVYDMSNRHYVGEATKINDDYSINGGYGGTSGAVRYNNTIRDTWRIEEYNKKNVASDYYTDDPGNGIIGTGDWEYSLRCRDQSSAYMHAHCSPNTRAEVRLAQTPDDDDKILLYDRYYFDASALEHFGLSTSIGDFFVEEETIYMLEPAKNSYTLRPVSEAENEE